MGLFYKVSPKTLLEARIKFLLKQLFPRCKKTVLKKRLLPLRGLGAIT